MPHARLAKYGLQILISWQALVVAKKVLRVLILAAVLSLTAPVDDSGSSISNICGKIKLWGVMLGKRNSWPGLFDGTVTIDCEKLYDTGCHRVVETIQISAFDFQGHTTKRTNKRTRTPQCEESAT